MNFFSLLSLFAFLVYVFLGFYAFLLDRRSRLNQVFLAVCLDLAFWSFAYSFVYGAPTKEVVWFWFRISALGWCTFPGLILHFLLVLSQKRSLLSKQWIYPVLYGPGFLVLLRALTGVVTAKDFDRTPLGWVEVGAPENVWFWVHSIYLIVCLVLGLVAVFHWGGRSKVVREQRQARLVVITLSLSAGVAFIINLVIPALQSHIVPAVAPVTIFIWGAGVWRAMIKYRLMVLSPAIASEAIVARMKDLLILTDSLGVILKINPQTEKVLGYQGGDLIGQSVSLILKDKEIAEEFANCLRKKSMGMVEKEIHFKTLSGDEIPVDVSCSVIKDDAESPVGAVIIGQDLRPTKELEKEIQVRIGAEEALRKAQENLELRIRERTAELGESNQALQAEITERKSAEEIFRTLFMRLPIGSYIAQDGEIKIVNPEFERTTGFSEDELLSLPTLSLVHADDRNRVKKWSVQMLKGERSLPYEYRAWTKDGRMRWIMETVTSIRFQGRLATLGCFLDITDRKEAEETIRTLAYYDPLTGLPNRILFLDRFNLALAQANRRQLEIALLTLDLDRFKEVNDTLGHSAGDQLLKEAGQRLASLLRKTDTIARMGGDEFMILLSEIRGKEDVTQVSRKILDIFQIPFHVEDQSIPITASIGIAVFPDDGRTADLLIKNSDRAMYRAKEAGRNNCQFYQPNP